MGQVMRALGLMSGTSMDGIDVALIETDGEEIVRREAWASYAYDGGLRAALKKAVAEARDLRRRDERPGSLGEVERILTEANAHAIADFVADKSIEPGSIDVVGYHGQTVLHRPEIALTVQLADGPLLSQMSGLPVVYDLRAADMAAGGQGAPLAPVYHRALAAGLADRPLAFLNIGGVSNITWIGRDGALVAFDMGPGGALVDDWVALRTDGARTFDDGGAMAASGKIDARIVEEFSKHAYFAKPLPKSLDRDAFALSLVDGLSPEDGAATLSAMTAEAIALGLGHLEEPPRLLIACGGGRKNATIVAMIAERSGIKVITAEDAGFDGDSVEAEAWAYMAVRSLKGLPITFPGTTGTAAPLTGGVVALPSSPAA